LCIAQIFDMIPAKNRIQAAIVSSLPADKAQRRKSAINQCAAVPLSHFEGDS